MRRGGGGGRYGLGGEGFHTSPPPPRLSESHSTRQLLAPPSPAGPRGAGVSTGPRRLGGPLARAGSPGAAAGVWDGEPVDFALL